MKKQLLLVLFALAVFIFSCRKNSFNTSGNALIQFSADTLLFDTVFVSTGSITEQVKIITNDQVEVERFILSVSRAAKQGAAG